MEEPIRHKHQTLREYKRLLNVGEDSDSALENSTLKDQVLDVSVPTENDDRFTSISQRPVNPLSFEHSSSNTLPLPKANMVAHLGFWQDQNTEKVAFLDTSSNSNYFAEKTNKFRFPINLSDWKPKLQDDQLLIVGVLGEEKRLSAHFVKRRLYSYIFFDEHETLCSLFGEMAPNTSLPALIKENFLNGIPENWSLLCQYWKSLSQDNYSEIPPMIPIVPRGTDLTLNSNHNFMQPSNSTPYTVPQKRLEIPDLSRINTDSKSISKRRNKYSTLELRRKVNKYTELLKQTLHSNLNDDSTSCTTTQNVPAPKFPQKRITTFPPKNNESNTKLPSKKLQSNTILSLPKKSQIPIALNCISESLSSNIDAQSKLNFESLKQKQDTFKSLLPRFEELVLINKQLPLGTDNATNLDQNGNSSDSDMHDYIRKPNHKISFISNTTVTNKTLNKNSRTNAKQELLLPNKSKVFDFFPNRNSCEITSFHVSDLNTSNTKKLSINADTSSKQNFKSFKQKQDTLKSLMPQLEELPSATNLNQNGITTENSSEINMNDYLRKPNHKISFISNTLNKNSRSHSKRELFPNKTKQKDFSPNKKSCATSFHVSDLTLNLTNTSSTKKLGRNSSNTKINKDLLSNDKLINIVDISNNSKSKPTKVQKSTNNIDISNISNKLKSIREQNSKIPNNSGIESAITQIKSNLRSLDIDSNSEDSEITNNKSKSQVLVLESYSENSDDSISNTVNRNILNKPENTNKIVPNEKSQINPKSSSIHSDSESDVQMSNNKPKSKTVKKIDLKSPTNPLNKKIGNIIAPDSDSIVLKITNNANQSPNKSKNSTKALESKSRKNRKNVVEKNNHILHEKSEVYVEDKRRSVIKNVTSEMDKLKLNSTELNLTISQRGRVRCQALPFWTGKRLTNHSVSNSTVMDSTENRTIYSKTTFLNKAKNLMQNANLSTANSEIKQLEQKSSKTAHLLVVLNNIRSNIRTQHTSPEKVSHTKMENKLSDSKKAQITTVLKDIKTKCQRPSVNPAKHLIDSETEHSDMSCSESPINSKRTKLRNIFNPTKKKNRIEISNAANAENLIESSNFSTKKWSKISSNSNRNHEQNQTPFRSCIQSNEGETNITLVTHNSRIDSNKNNEQITTASRNSIESNEKETNITLVTHNSRIDCYKDENKATKKKGSTSKFSISNYLKKTNNSKMDDSHISTNSTPRSRGSSKSNSNHSKKAVIAEEYSHNSNTPRNRTIARSKRSKKKIIAEEEINNQTLEGSEVFLNSENVQHVNTPINCNISNSRRNRFKTIIVNQLPKLQTASNLEIPQRSNTPRSRSTSNFNNNFKTSVIVDSSTTYQTASNIEHSQCSNTSRSRSISNARSKYDNTVISDNSTAPKCAIPQRPTTRSRSSSTRTKCIINIDNPENLQIDSNIENGQSRIDSTLSRSILNQRSRSYSNARTKHDNTVISDNSTRFQTAPKCAIPQNPNTRSRRSLPSTKTKNTGNAKSLQIDSKIEDGQTRIASTRSRSKSNQRSRSPVLHIDLPNAETDISKFKKPKTSVILRNSSTSNISLDKPNIQNKETKCTESCNNAEFKKPKIPIKLRNSSSSTLDKSTIQNKENKSTELCSNSDSVSDETTKNNAKIITIYAETIISSKSEKTTISNLNNLSSSNGEYYQNVVNMIPIVSLPRLNLENYGMNSTEHNSKTDSATTANSTVKNKNKLNTNQMSDSWNNTKSVHTIYKRSKRKGVTMEFIEHRNHEKLHHSHNTTKNNSDILSRTNHLSFNTTISQRGRSRVPTLQFWTGERLSTKNNQITIEASITNNPTISNITKTSKPTSDKNALQTNSNSILTSLNSIDPITSNNITESQMTSSYTNSDDIQLPVLQRSKKSLQLEENNAGTQQKNSTSSARVLRNISKSSNTNNSCLESENDSDGEPQRNKSRSQNKGKSKKAIKKNNSKKDEKLINVHSRRRRRKVKQIPLPNNAPELSQCIKYNKKVNRESIESQSSQTSSSSRRRKLFSTNASDTFDQLTPIIKESQNFVLRIPTTSTGSDDGMSELSSFAYKKIKLF